MTKAAKVAQVRIALVSSVPTFPCDGGNRARLLALTQSFRTLGHEVDFIFLPSRRSGESDYNEHQRFFGRDNFFLLDRDGVKERLYLARRGIAKAQRRMFKLLGTDQAYYHALDEIFYRGFVPQLEELHAQRNYGAVVVVYVFNSLALQAFPSNVLKIIDTHDSFSDRHKIFQKAGRMPTGYSLRPADERRGLVRADIAMAIQDDEAAGFRELTNGIACKVTTVSHLLDLSRQVTQPPRRAACFIGSAFEANVVSLNYFTQRIMPLVLKERPDFKLYLGGSVGSAVADHASIVKLGRVPHVADALERGSILVNPIVLGTGINIKVLDALACGVPVVSTEFGARGLRHIGRDAVTTVANDDEAGFSRALIRLMDDNQLWQRASLQARQAARDWHESQIRALGNVLATPVESIMPAAEKAWLAPLQALNWLIFDRRPIRSR